jgi:amylosucrase
MLGAYNVMPEPRHVPLSVLRDLGIDPAVVLDHVSGTTPTIRDEAVQLPPYAAVWLTA